MEHRQVERPKVAISECLLGHPVRFNKGHKRSKFCTDVLSNHVDFTPICPEVAIGLPTPRDPIRLIATDQGPAAVQVDDYSIEHTEALQGFADTQISMLKDYCGYVFMQKSPSCGLRSTKVYGAKGHPIEWASGIFAERITEALPNLPVTEAGQLNDAAIRENFVTQVLAYHEWKTEIEAAPTRAKLQRFHHRFKLHWQTHDESLARQWGKRLASAEFEDVQYWADRYITDFMAAMRKPPSRRAQSNALVKLLHPLKKLINEGERQELNSLIEQYRQGFIPIIVPMTMIKHFVRKYAMDEIESVAFISPYPAELGLRNAI